VTISLGGSAYGGSTSVYGRIPGSQTVLQGAFSDTVTVTLNY
jgi:spore coat protein U-like protein